MHVVFDVVVWYVSSIVATTGSKDVISGGVSSHGLTLVQLAASACIGGVVVKVQNVTNVSLDKGARRRMWLLAAVFTFGFVAQNLAFELGMDVGLLMTLRSLEPGFSFFYSTLILQDPDVKFRLIAPVVVIIMGAALCSFASSECTVVGVATVMVANVLFVWRIILAKRFTTSGMDATMLFYKVCCYGTVIQLGVLAIDRALNPYETFKIASLYGDNWLLLLLCAVFFYLYLQFSFIVASKVHPISHAVANALRRPAIIVAAAVWFREDLSTTKVVGIMLACGGAVTYSVMRAAGGVDKNSEDGEHCSDDSIPELKTAVAAGTPRTRPSGMAGDLPNVDL